RPAQGAARGPVRDRGGRRADAAGCGGPGGPRPAAAGSGGGPARRPAGPGPLRRRAARSARLRVAQPAHRRPARDAARRAARELEADRVPEWPCALRSRDRPARAAEPGRRAARTRPRARSLGRAPEREGGAGRARREGQGGAARARVPGVNARLAQRVVRGGSGSGSGAPTRPRWEAARRTVFFLAALAIAAVVYRPALGGPFVSDDLLYIVNNAGVRELDRAELPDLLDPFGAAALDAGNSAPLHLLPHAADWRVFAMDVQGYHAVNLVLHALCATLLLALLESQGIAPRLAVFAAVFFLLHPANVEAVAWISQLKSVLALALVLGALLEFERRPLLA